MGGPSLTGKSGGGGRKREARLFGKRKCHDCGRGTHNYRCDKCWVKIRGDEPDSVTPFDEVVG